MNDKPEIRNAVIKSTMLGLEDHGIMSCMLHLDYGGTCQGFGGYALDEWNEPLKARIGTGYGLEFIKRILATVGVESWEKLSGSHVRVESNWGKVFRIGHFLEDRWFNPDEDLKFLFKENNPLKK
jgi:hypothetical protein